MPAMLKKPVATIVTVDCHTSLDKSNLTVPETEYFITLYNQSLKIIFHKLFSYKKNLYIYICIYIYIYIYIYNTFISRN